MSTRTPSILALTFLVAGPGLGHAANTDLVLTNQGTTPSTNCTFSSADGMSADTNGVLRMTGQFTAGDCQSTPVTPPPLPVIALPASSNWGLTSPMAQGQSTELNWAAAYASSCTYRGSLANGATQIPTWPLNSTACTGTSSCSAIKKVTLQPPTAGTYTLSLDCTGDGGSVSSATSATIVVSASAVVITGGPSTWATPSLTEGTSTTGSFTWSATNAAECHFNGYLDGAALSSAALSSFMGPSAATSCTGTGCGTTRTVTTFTPASGTAGKSYRLDLVCTNSAGVPTTSQGSNWQVGSPATTCASNGNWTRQTSGKAWYLSTATSNGINVSNLTEFSQVWGRESKTDTTVIGWPGENVLAGPGIEAGKYVSLQFSTGTSTTARTTLYVEATNYGNNSSPLSVTVSTQCGDFKTNSSNIPAGCFRNSMISDDTLIITTNQSLTGTCRLPTSGGPYYINIVNAPISTSGIGTANSCSLSPCRVMFMNYNAN